MHKRFDIEAYYRNKTKSFLIDPLIIGATPRREEANRDSHVRIRKGAGSGAAHGAAARADGAAGEGRDRFGKLRECTVNDTSLCLYS